QEPPANRGRQMHGSTLRQSLERNSANPVRKNFRSATIVKTAVGDIAHRQRFLRAEVLIHLCREVVSSLMVRCTKIKVPGDPRYYVIAGIWRWINRQHFL